MWGLFKMTKEKPLSEKVIKKYPNELVLSKWLHIEDVALAVKRLKEVIIGDINHKLINEIFGEFK